MAERHVPSPQNLRLNIWTDGSPAKHTVGGMGICYGKWLPTQTDGLTKSLSFVVPRVPDANECELVALADAMLVVLDEIKENFTTLRANNWKTRVMVWSDLHTAVKYLENPQNLRRFGTGRPAEVRALILHLVSETDGFPIKGPIEFYWVPGVCTAMHQTADFMTKNSMRVGEPALQPASLPAADSKSVKLHGGGAGNDDQSIGKIISKHAPESTELGSRNILKRRASARIDIENDRPHKTIRRNEGVVDGDSGSISSIQILNGRTAPTAHVNNQEEVNFVAIDQIIQHSRERGSLDTIWQQAEQLQEDQRDMIKESMEKQLLANQKPFDPARFFFRMRSWSEDGQKEACFPNTLSVVEDAVSKLPDPMRADMQNAVEQQHEENRIWGAHLAIMRVIAAPRSTAAIRSRFSASCSLCGKSGTCVGFEADVDNLLNCDKDLIYYTQVCLLQDKKRFLGRLGGMMVGRGLNYATLIAFPRHCLAMAGAVVEGQAGVYGVMVAWVP
ncbi:hypothetical protein LA080_006605 [Diaporthe eres]|nr:hypothetical protein LA080_006605 [Diaporthe eres]